MSHSHEIMIGEQDLGLTLNVQVLSVSLTSVALEHTNCNCICAQCSQKMKQSLWRDTVSMGQSETHVQRKIIK